MASSAPTVLRQLRARDLAEALAVCEAKPAQCALIAAWLAEGGLAAGRGSLFAEEIAPGKALGLLLLATSGIAISVLEDPSHLDRAIDLATAIPGMPRVLVGDRAQISALELRLSRRGFSARLRHDQLAYMADRASFDWSADTLDLRRASRDHLDVVTSASAAMAREEARDDPQGRHPERFRQRIAERLAQGRDFIHLRGRELVFKCNVAPVGPSSGQIEGIYTAPSFRRQGIGRSGTASVTRWVLGESARACLLVNEDNRPAVSLYESLGYRRSFKSRTVFLR